MEKNQKRIIVVTAIILVVFTVLSFVIPFNKTGVFWVAYLFGIVSIVLQLFVMKSTFAGESPRSKFYGFPIAKIGIIYLILQLVLSLIFMGLAAIAPVWVAIICFVLLLAAAAIGCVGADAARDEVERQDKTVTDHTAFMKTLCLTMVSVANKCVNSETRKELQELADAVKYSDPVSSKATEDLESELMQQIEELKKTVAEGNTQAVSEKCKIIAETLEKRNYICKTRK